MLAKLYSWYGQKAVWIVFSLLGILLISGVVIKLNTTSVETAEVALPTVAVRSVAELGSQQSISLLGTVRAVSEAQIQTETAGRVTSVNVNLGDTVRAGQTIASLENAQQRAAVLQAEGVYDAAVANASVSDISTTQAEASLRSSKIAAINTIQSSYSTVNNGFFTTIDDLYNDPTSPLTYPYLSDDNRSFLRQERLAFQDIIPEWQSKTSSLNSDNDLTISIEESIAYSVRTRVLADTFIAMLQDRDADTIAGQSVPTLVSDLSALRSSLESNVLSLENARSAIESAEDNLQKAQIGGTNAELSAANAQVKQALGALRSAQASLAKTILTSPIAGTVNELNIRIGDFVGSFEKVAKIANNNALEITVFVGENDLSQVSIGAVVLIDNQYEGVVTNIGAGIDSTTQKTEVKIATETNDLTNGDTVTVSLQTTEIVDTSSTILLPITAVKFSAENGSVFTVEDNQLVENPVEIGQVRGSFVEILDGVEFSSEIVIDARGLTAGTKVEATN